MFYEYISNLPPFIYGCIRSRGYRGRYGAGDRYDDADK